MNNFYLGLLTGLSLFIIVDYVFKRLDALITRSPSLADAVIPKDGFQFLGRKAIKRKPKICDDLAAVVVETKNRGL